MTSSTLTPEAWRVTEDGSVPLADVSKTAPVPHASLAYAVREGLVTVTAQYGQGRRRYISVEDALLILAAASLAVAAGVALVAMLRTLRSTGATVTPTGINIPVTIPIHLASVA